MRSPFPLGVVAALLSVGPSAGCTWFLPAPSPMQSIRYELGNGKARCLLVLLPGAGDSAGDFADHHFIEAVRARHLSVDVIAANATLGYYFKETLTDRISADVLSPNKAKGYEQVWAAGISMGGFGSLLYSMKRPGELNGVLALAPFLGDRSIVDEVRDSGGVAKWAAPPKAPVTEDNYQRQLWRWLQAVTAGTEAGPDLFLGYGLQDKRVGEANTLLAPAIPSGHLYTLPGGHDWDTWGQLFARFLDDSDFARVCAVK